MERRRVTKIKKQTYAIYQVVEHVKKCKHALVIIDESEKLPEGTLNAISPFLDKNVAIDGVDYRNTIFILLSNTAGKCVYDGMCYVYVCHKCF